MATFVKKIVQTPQEIEKSKKHLLPLERLINAGLQLIDPSYGIRALVQRPDGKFEFECPTEFAAKHENEIQKLFSLLEEDMSFKQFSIYVPDVLQKKLKHRALELNVTTSALIAALIAEIV